MHTVLLDNMYGVRGRMLFAQALMYYMYSHLSELWIIVHV